MIKLSDLWATQLTRMRVFKEKTISSTPKEMCHKSWESDLWHGLRANISLFLYIVGKVSVS